MKQKSRRKPARTAEHGFIYHAHHILIGIILAFIGAAIVLGEMMDVYDAVWWWDDMLHGSSGLIFGLVGLFVIYAINARSDMRISPFFVAMFVGCFAITLGVVWEIYEFTSDVMIKSTMQQWNMGPQAIVMGREYQSMGLRDTMSDLITATAGALIASTFAFFVYGRKRRTLAQVMRHALPHMRAR